MTDQARAEAAPKAFISYAWSSEPHKIRVLELAQKLRSDGIDVQLDRWHLREGDDANHFMERMIADPLIAKVLLIFDKVYVEKADGRLGGVGKETQIVTPSVYLQSREEASQNKFVGVVFELGPDEKPYRPAYYGDRIFIDLSSADNYAIHYEQLLRWLHGEPANLAPPVGSKPIFLNKDALALPTTSRASRVVSAFKSNSTEVLFGLYDYFDVLLIAISSFEMKVNNAKDINKEFEASIASILPYRNEWISVIMAASKSVQAVNATEIYCKFFESLLDLTQPDFSRGSYYEAQFDVAKFVLYEMFVIFIAVLIEHRHFEAVQIALDAGYFSERLAQRNATVGLRGFGVLNQHVLTIDHINQSASQRYYSLQGKILQDRIKQSGLVFEKVMQADVMLFLRSVCMKNEGAGETWFPWTYPYLARTYRPLELFARAESKSFFSRIAPVIGVKDAVGFRELVADCAKSHWQERIDWKTITGSERIATRI